MMDDEFLLRLLRNSALLLSAVTSVALISWAIGVFLL